ncbi:hypothetical protein JQ615_31100 [Bradyrhizobium jicamae]|uniref:Uncharacterized protein n=1 Tax=Bradyrhizobium jicamae TaxID=280332 RepID=A0ABS5FSV4_9BRAD|nr:hypothetical protein [Bradyrhizobium jicamae]MBR0799826.1 hypothetical protein [Bradyrhizobium jicamae]
MSKRTDRPFRGGPSKDWIKVKKPDTPRFRSDPESQGACALMSFKGEAVRSTALRALFSILVRALVVSGTI